MRPSTLALSACLAGLSAALSGCSWIVVDGPPSGHETMESFECDEARWPAWFDVAVMGLGVFGAVTAEDDPEEEWFEISAGTKVIGNTAIALVAGASAVTGFKRTNACRDAKQALLERTGGMGNHSAAPFPPAEARSFPVVQREKPSAGTGTRTQKGVTPGGF